MHASHIKKLQPNFQSLLLNFKICNFVTKKTFSKKSDMYLMKIQISFEFFFFFFKLVLKNIDKFNCLEEIRFENTDQFFEF